MTNVQIIRRKNDFVLVQWEVGERMYRAWVLPNMVDESGLSPVVNRPERGIPYGVDFSQLVVLQASAQILDTELKRRGIWTLNDLRTNAQTVLGALQTTYGIDLAALLQAAKLLEGNKHG